MDDYTYKFVPFIPTLKLGIFGPQNANAISQQLEALVGKHAALGWEYVRLEQVSVVHSAGCLATMFGKSSHAMDYDLVVFRMRKAGAFAGPDSGELTGEQSGADAAPTARPVPGAVKSMYAAVERQHVALAGVRENCDTFTYDDDLEEARAAFLDAWVTLADKCGEEEPGVGRAVARKAQSDFSEFLSDDTFVEYLRKLQSRA